MCRANALGSSSLASSSANAMNASQGAMVSEGRTPSPVQPPVSSSANAGGSIASTCTLPGSPASLIGPLSPGMPTMMLSPFRNLAAADLDCDRDDDPCSVRGDGSSLIRLADTLEGGDAAMYMTGGSDGMNSARRDSDLMDTTAGSSGSVAGDMGLQDGDLSFRLQAQSGNNLANIGSPLQLSAALPAGTHSPPPVPRGLHRRGTCMHVRAQSATNTSRIVHVLISNGELSVCTCTWE